MRGRRRAGDVVVRRARLLRALAGGIAAIVAALTLSGGAASAASPHWSLVSSPNGGSTPNGILSGVSCVSSSFCMAAGYYYDGTEYQTLIERWTGSGWSLVSSPNTSSSETNFLNGVSCVSSSFCTTVGDGGEEPLVEMWNGSSWSLVSSPNSFGLPDNRLAGVSCVSSSFCMATGFFANHTHEQTLIEKWNGSSWSLVNSPNRSSTYGNDLGGVSCVSSSFCMAAGSYYDEARQPVSLIEKWNGSSWSLVSAPNDSVQNNAVYGVSCASKSFCMAATSSTGGQTLIEKWNGSSWSRVSSPNRSTTEPNVPYGVSCISSSFCMAAGSYSDQTLIEKW